MLFAFSDKNVSNNKQNDQCADADAGAPVNTESILSLENQGAEEDDHGANKIGEFSKNIEETEILVGLFLWNHLPKVRAGQGLNTTLTQTNAYGQHPEMPVFGEHHAKNADGDVHEDKVFDQLQHAVFLRQHLS